MKRFLLFIGFSVFSFLYAQESTFIKFNLSGNGLYARQILDNTYLTAGMNAGKFFLAKYSKEGILIWSKSYNDYLVSSSFGFTVSFDGNIYVAVQKRPVINQNFLSILKLNLNGDIIAEKLIPDTTRKFFCSSMKETPNGDFLIGLNSLSSPNESGVILVNHLLEPYWYKNNLYQSSNQSKVVLFAENNWFWLASFGLNQILKVDYQGNLISSHTIESPVYDIIKTSLQTYLIASDNLIRWIDNNAVTIKSKDYSSFRILSVFRDNNNLVLAGLNRIVKTDLDGNPILIVQRPEIFSEVSGTNDGGYLFAGTRQTSTSTNTIIIKTNNQLKALSVANPNGGEYLIASPPSIFQIAANSVRINKIKIEFSSDKGTTWQLLADNYPADTVYYWSVNFIESKNCLIKISELNSGIYDISDNTFEITKFKKGISFDFINVNNVFMWFSNNGVGSHNQNTGQSGFYWPARENKTTTSIFQDGLVYGGKMNGQIRVNGNTWRQGLQPGRILPNGMPDTADLPKYRIYKIRKGWETMPAGPQRDRYEFDYLNWPAELGAPWIDINKNGIYDPNIDKPDFAGDEVCFYVCNDMDSNITKGTYGSLPLGLEFQTTIYGFDRTDKLGDVVFKKYKIINKGQNIITDMFISYWSDDDLGDATDDYVGCDSILKLGYTYNSNITDQEYGTPVPAVAHQYLQTPAVLSLQTDSARIGNGWKKGYKNIPMTSFVFYIGASPVYRDPSQGVYAGTLQFYNQILGKSWTGADFVDPVTNKVSKFLLSGDPESKTGWYEGGWAGAPTAGDRRYLLSSGPFNMSPNDTQEVVIAIYMAKGTSHLNSVTKLKEYAAYFRDLHNMVISDVKNDKISLPNEFVLYQNYPNPFNPVTTIKYSIPEISGLNKNMSVKLQVYDILGNEVETLFDGINKPGNYTVEFNARKYASGVYFYKLTSGSVSITKKMQVLK